MIWLAHSPIQSALTKNVNLEQSNRVRKSMSWDSESKSQISISTEATTVDKEPEYYERLKESIWPNLTLFDPLWPYMTLNLPEVSNKTSENWQKKSNEGRTFKNMAKCSGSKIEFALFFWYLRRTNDWGGFSKWCQFDGAMKCQKEIFYIQFKNPPKGKGITLEGFTISIHQHYIKEKGGL